MPARLEWKGWRIHVVLLSALLGLALLWGGRFSYWRLGYEQPLARMLKQRPDIISYTLQQQGNQLVVEVLPRRLDNLPRFYNSLSRDIQKTVGQKPFLLVLQDRRDPVLQDLWPAARLAMEEAVQRGNYVEMAALIRQQAGAREVRAELLVDEARLYLQMYHREAYLYDIVFRPSQTRPGTAPPG
ncbi:MAG: hypothetical protein ACUVTU_06195 [Desulfurispora sp.]|uniref:hypothetical protein n=1 Tax=Desulfurispora sp. TaxID=3014275 RepID=UPI004049A6AB